MASEIQTGIATIWGITASGAAISMTGYASFLLDSVDAAHNGTIEDIKDAVGFDASTVFANGHTDLDITWTPTGATRAAIATSMASMVGSSNAVFVLPLSQVALANFKLTAFNGNYQYRGTATLKLMQGTGKMTMKIRSYDDATQNSSMVTTVSS